MSRSRPRGHDGRVELRHLPWVSLGLILAFTPAFARAQTPATTEPPVPAAAEDAPPPASHAPQVADWINHALPVREAATVFVAPDESAETHGRIAPGREVMVLGTLVGGGWLQVRLPDDSIGYVKAGAVSATSEPPSEPAAPAASAQEPAPPPPAAEGPAPTLPPTASADEPPAVEVSGRPLVRDTATLVIAGRAVLLAGIVGVGGEAVDTIQDLIASRGDRLSCVPQAGMDGYFVCHLVDGQDLAKVLLVNGDARTAAGAPEDYAVEQNAAVDNQRGIWAMPDTCVHWTIADPVATVAFTDDADQGLYFVSREPFVLVAGEPVPMVFVEAEGGWGYWDGDHHWYGAPDRWRRHLDYVYPHGQGLRDPEARAHALHDVQVRESVLHEAAVHQAPIMQHQMVSRRLPIAPVNARPAVFNPQGPFNGARVAPQDSRVKTGPLPQRSMAPPFTPNQPPAMPSGPEPVRRVGSTPLPAPAGSRINPLPVPAGGHLNLPAGRAPVPSAKQPVCKKLPC